MTELNSTFVFRVILFESRLVEYFSNKREQFHEALIRLSYTRYSVRLVYLMFQLCPRSTMVIIVGRFLQGLLPSVDLRIKGGFLDIV